MYRYKVVTKDRKSVFVGAGSNCSKKEKLRQLEYLPNTTVTAPINSMGIFVFADYHEAKRLAYCKEEAEIIRVKPIGRGIKLIFRPENYSLPYLEHLHEHLKTIKKLQNNKLLGMLTIREKGFEFYLPYYNDSTIVYKAVHVVD